MPTDPHNTPPPAGHRDAPRAHADDAALARGDADGRPPSQDLARRALEALGSALVICDAAQPDAPVVYANRVFEAVTGYPREAVLGRSLPLLQGPDTDPAALGRIRAALRRGHPHRGVLLNYRRDGSPFWNEVAFAPIRDGAGVVTHWVVVQADVSERMAEHEALRAATARLETLIASIQAGVVVETDDGQVVLANRAFCDIMGIGVPPEALAGADVVPMALDTALRFADPDGFIGRALAVRRAQRPVLAEELRLADGRVWERDYVPVFPGEDGAEQGGHLWVFRDVTERHRIEQRVRDAAALLGLQKDELERANAALEAANARLEEANARLEALATTDGLTGLFNHRVLMERLAEELRRSRRYGGPLSLVVCDVDRFKDHNDAHGHLAGNAALRRVAQVLRDHARETDLAARFGGEEFALILPHTAIGDAVALAERLRAAVEGADCGGRSVTASFGVCELTPEAETPEDLIARADAALYRAKAGGRNGVAWA